MSQHNLKTTLGKINTLLELSTELGEQWDSYILAGIRALASNTAPHNFDQCEEDPEVADALNNHGHNSGQNSRPVPMLLQAEYDLYTSGVTPSMAINVYMERTGCSTRIATALFSHALETNSINFDHDAYLRYLGEKRWRS